MKNRFLCYTVIFVFSAPMLFACSNFEKLAFEKSEIILGANLAPGSGSTAAKAVSAEAICNTPGAISINQLTEGCVGDFVRYRASLPAGSCPVNLIWTSSGDGAIVSTSEGVSTITAETFGPDFRVMVSFTTSSGTVSARWQTIFAINGCFGSPIE